MSSLQRFQINVSNMGVACMQQQRLARARHDLVNRESNAEREPTRCLKCTGSSLTQFGLKSRLVRIDDNMKQLCL